jgi:hypothetical protein
MWGKSSDICLTTDCQVGSRFPDIFDGIVEAVMLQILQRPLLGEGENNCW